MKFVQGGDGEEKAYFTKRYSHWNLDQPVAEQINIDVEIQEQEPGENGFSFDSVIRRTKTSETMILECIVIACYLNHVVVQNLSQTFKKQKINTVSCVVFYRTDLQVDTHPEGESYCEKQVTVYWNHYGKLTISDEIKRYIKTWTIKWNEY